MEAETILEVVVKDDDALVMADMASIWADLQLVEMSIHSWKEITEAKDLYLRRALWEQAVIAYSRCFDQSRRRRIPTELEDQMVGGSILVHEETLRWRNKLIAHRVDDDAAWSIVSLNYKDDSDGPLSVRVRVDLPHGPEDDAMAIALGELARELKNRLWQQWVVPLEARLLDEYADNEDMQSRAVIYEERQRTGRFFVTLNPSGAPVTAAAKREAGDFLNS